MLAVKFKSLRATIGHVDLLTGEWFADYVSEPSFLGDPVVKCCLKSVSEDECIAAFHLLNVLRDHQRELVKYVCEGKPRERRDVVGAHSDKLLLLIDA
jgi:hypothetical protein